jgi:hypothetical protein
MKIFLSAVSSEFKACRDALASDLRADGADVRVQEEFTQYPGTLLEKLERYIAECDRVIFLIGDAYGCEPPPAEAPTGSPVRSYTQWEYYLAQGERFDKGRAPSKPTYLYFATADLLRQNPATQSQEAAARQQGFINEILASGRDRQHFSSLYELRAKALRDAFRLRDQPVIQNLPFLTIGSLFRGRDELMERLRERLERDRSPGAAIIAIQAFHGLGGVGKSRLAVEYALRYERDYRALLFVSAETPESLRAGLAGLCGSRVLSLPEKAATEQDVQVEAALRWLREHPGWLLILDAADTRAASEAVEQMLPGLAGGHVLITSRMRDWSGAVDPLELGVLEPDAAEAFLLERTRGRRRETPTDAEDARELAKDLGGLALALEQAGAYVGKRRISLATYLHRWRVADSDVRSWHDVRLMQYPRSVATAWQTAMDQLSAPAGALLRFLCWLAPEPIPRGVFETDAARKALSLGAGLPGAAGAAPGLAFAAGGVEEALAELGGFSLIHWESGNEAFRAHRLVQEVTRERLRANQRTFWLSGALAVIDGYLPGDPPPQDVRSWPRWEPLRPHVALVVRVAGAAGIPEPTAWLMNSLGLFLRARGA